MSVARSDSLSLSDFLIELVISSKCTFCRESAFTRCVCFVIVYTSKHVYIEEDTSLKQNIKDIISRGDTI